MLKKDLDINTLKIRMYKFINLSYGCLIKNAGRQI